LLVDQSDGSWLTFQAMVGTLHVSLSVNEPTIAGRGSRG